MDPIFVPKRRAAGWYLRCDLGPRGVATRGLPRGAWEVPAGEALGASPPQHVRSMCLLLPQSLGGAEVPLGLARLASGGGASMGAGRDGQLGRGPPSGVGTIRSGTNLGMGCGGHPGKGPPSGVGTIRGGNQFRARDAVGIGCEPCGGGRSKEGSLVRAGVAQARDGRERVWAVRSEPGGSELAGRWRARLIRVGIRVQREKPNEKRERKSKQGRTCTNL